MLPSRFAPAQSSAMRKSRLEGKPSMLPKPRRPGSTDRLSTEARRPSAAGHRSSSAEPARGTFGPGRMSREASASKLPVNGRSRSQQSERFGQSSMTPLRSSQYSRATTTPVRTPSEDRASRSWQTSVERAVAFVTIKDQRPISNVAWQRAECARVQEALAARRGAGGAGGGGGAIALIRPLTIARFVDIVGALLDDIIQDTKLNTDNYVTKLPHLSKRVLYPGTLSKSWLKTVNTLHAFPHALALIAYLLDIVNHIETPVSNEWLYIEKDELACLRRKYLFDCWIRFQEPGHQFEDLNEEYLRNLKELLGNDEKKITELTQVVKQYEACLEDEVEAAARAAESRRAERCSALLAALRAARAERRQHRADTLALRAQITDHGEALRHLDVEIERANVENQQLKHEVETQPLTVEQRVKLLDEVDYALRVQDSKQVLAEQITKLVVSKETELALWQRKALDSCVQYKQALIHLAARCPDLAALDVQEKELMTAECVSRVARAADVLRARAAALAEQRAEHARERTAHARQKAAALEETQSKFSEIESTLQREQQALDAEHQKESAEAAAWSAEQRELAARVHELRARIDEYARADTELDFWEKQDAGWVSKLSGLREYIHRQTEEVQRALDAARARRVQLVVDKVRVWNKMLDDSK